MCQQMSAGVAPQQKLTIQLPTQPQPISGVKTVTYVNPVISSFGGTVSSHGLQGHQAITTSAAANYTPLKLTTTGFAYTPTGKKENKKTLYGIF